MLRVAAVSWMQDHKNCHLAEAGFAAGRVGNAAIGRVPHSVHLNVWSHFGGFRGGSIG